MRAGFAFTICILAKISSLHALVAGLWRVLIMLTPGRLCLDGLHSSRNLFFACRGGRLVASFDHAYAREGKFAGVDGHYI